MPVPPLPLQFSSETKLTEEEGNDLIATILRENDAKRVLDDVINIVCKDDGMTDHIVSGNVADEEMPDLNDVLNDVPDDMIQDDILSEVPLAGMLYASLNLHY